MHQLYGFGENSRLVGERNTGVDIQHVSTGCDLRQRITLHTTVITDFHFFGHDLAPGRIDSLTNQYEGALKADDQFSGGRADNRFRHCFFLKIPLNQNNLKPASMLSQA